MASSALTAPTALCQTANECKTCQRERLPKTHRYRLTDEGLRTALFYTRVYARILRPAMAPVVPAAPTSSPQALRHFLAAEGAVNSWCDQAHIAA